MADGPTPEGASKVVRKVLASTGAAVVAAGTIGEAPSAIGDTAQKAATSFLDQRPAFGAQAQQDQTAIGHFEQNYNVSTGWPDLKLGPKTAEAAPPAQGAPVKPGGEAPAKPTASPTAVPESAAEALAREEKRRQEIITRNKANQLKDSNDQMEQKPGGAVSSPDAKDKKIEDLERQVKGLEEVKKEFADFKNKLSTDPSVKVFTDAQLKQFIDAKAQVSISEAQAKLEQERVAVAKMRADAEVEIANKKAEADKEITAKKGEAQSLDKTITQKKAEAALAEEGNIVLPQPHKVVADLPGGGVAAAVGSTIDNNLPSPVGTTAAKIGAGILGLGALRYGRRIAGAAVRGIAGRFGRGGGGTGGGPAGA